jgi:hypothetical protein
VAEPRPEVLRRTLETERTEIHTCKPATVRSYDADTQTAEIVIGVREVLPSGDADTPDDVGDYPIIPDVPVAHLRAGGFFIHFPIAEGTTGALFFSDTDLNAWRGGNGGPADPGVPTRHGLSGAFFVPGLHVRSDALASGDAPANALRLGREGGSVAIKITTSAIEAGGTGALAIGADVKAHLQAIETALGTIAAAAGAANSYVYATVLAASPIDTSILKGG